MNDNWLNDKRCTDAASDASKVGKAVCIDIEENWIALGILVPQTSPLLNAVDFLIKEASFCKKSNYCLNYQKEQF
jgi:hypothetical protein